MKYRIGIVGMGNVGASLVMQLPTVKNVASATFASRDVGNAKAAILDAAGAYPKQASTYTASEQLNGSFDIVVVTAGGMPHSDMSLDDLLQMNLDIVLKSIKGTAFKHLVVIGTPVDRLTEALYSHKDLKDKSIIGFGGQLDVARAIYALDQRDIKSTSDVFVIGEHGPRAVPVYSGEKDFEDIRSDTTTVLKRIGEFGKPRNMATGVQLARLISALCGEQQTLCVSAPHDDYDNLSLTWPYAINQDGVGKKVDITIGTKAQEAFDQLVTIRQKERGSL